MSGIGDVLRNKSSGRDRPGAAREVFGSNGSLTPTTGHGPANGSFLPSGEYYQLDEECPGIAKSRHSWRRAIRTPKAIVVKVRFSQSSRSLNCSDWSLLHVPRRP